MRSRPAPNPALIEQMKHIDALRGAVGGAMQATNYEPTFVPSSAVQNYSALSLTSSGTGHGQR